MLVEPESTINSLGSNLIFQDSKVTKVYRLDYLKTFYQHGIGHMDIDKTLA